MTAPVRVPTGLQSAAAALRHYERRQEIAAHNLANLSTDGFKAQRAFGQLLQAAGAPATVTTTDFAPGLLRQTGSAFDLAIARDGFLVVATPDGERLSRGGALQRDAAGRLTDAAGAPLLGERGPIVIPDGAAPTIAADGTVTAGDLVLGRLRVEGAPPGQPPRPEADGRFVPPDDRQPQPPESRTLRQGFLEGSNVEPVSAMVDMLAVQRHHALLERAIKVLDDARETATTQIGKPV